MSIGRREESCSASSLELSFFVIAFCTFGSDTKMLSLVIWLAGLLVLALLLIRGVMGGLVRRYTLFYGYLSFVLVTSCFLVFIYFAKPSEYRHFYWYTEFPGVALGCGIVWDIYRGSLKRFPGAARMVRSVLLFLLAVVLSKVLVDTWNGTAWWPRGTVVELERDLRTVQAVVLLGLAIVISSYRIPMGKNLCGMMLGYGLFIGTNVITLALYALFGDAFKYAWLYLQPLSYNAMLCIWCITLWSYKPVPIPKTEPSIEQDYQVLVAATRRGLVQARTYVRKAMRS